MRHFDFLKIWKEVMLSVLAGILLLMLVSSKNLRSELKKNRLLALVGAYIALLLIVGAYDLVTHRVGDKAVIYGWLIDIRPIGFFALVNLVFFSNSSRTIGFPWKKIILIPAAIVIAFGLLQFTVLPKDVLTHIGYSKATILPYQTVDSQPNFVRVQSTLRGPNPLGAYLVLIITLAASLMTSIKGRKKSALAILIAGSLVVIFGTYSRSAEVGLILSLATLLAVHQKQFVRRHILKLSITGLILVLGAGVIVLRHNYTAQNVLFHSSQESPSLVSSNAARTSALKSGALDIVHHPLGGGVGSAGPASLRNNLGQPKIAENYFLQIGQEVGILGMLLFVAINIIVGYELWLKREDVLAGALLASLVGISFIGLVSHVWTDDTLAYIWWGLAGIALSPVILSSRHKQDEQVHSQT